MHINIDLTLYRFLIVDIGLVDKCQFSHMLIENGPLKFGCGLQDPWQFRHILTTNGLSKSMFGLVDEHHCVGMLTRVLWLLLLINTTTWANKLLC